MPKQGVTEALFVLLNSIASVFEGEEGVTPPAGPAATQKSRGAAAGAATHRGLPFSKFSVTETIRQPAAASLKLVSSQLLLIENVLNAVYDSITSKIWLAFITYIKFCTVFGFLCVAIISSMLAATFTGLGVSLAVYTYVIPPSGVDVLPFALDYNSSVPAARIDLLGGDDCRADCLRTGGSQHEGCNITVELEVPETVHNMKIGVFTVRVSLWSENHEIASLKRSSVVVQERSELTKQAAELMLLPFTAAFGGSATTNKVVQLHMTPLLQRAAIDKDLSHILVEVAPSLHVTSSTLRVTTHTPGVIHRLLKGYPLVVTFFAFVLAASIAFGCNLVFWLVLACGLYYFLFVHQSEPSRPKTPPPFLPRKEATIGTTKPPMGYSPLQSNLTTLDDGWDSCESGTQ
eukprot:TRINITY_DN57966_c0_g1_i2.p2 TRINITY_DN57966_c0_g1~~TRINITY_DN57966_c0_g1_i2.p2  ORF type:complete len:404 (+),score=95.27 TRINITY_DN57966_c0_g1_i2:35-1246(+)